MCKKIKKQIKRSMPLFLIFSLIISSAVVGLVFNFDFNIYQLDDKNFGFTVDIPKVQADTATTSVTVRNAPPAFTAGPVENPSSTSTTPVNFGGWISFNATASDDEGNGYYLAICGTKVTKNSHFLFEL